MKTISNTAAARVVATSILCVAAIAGPLALGATAPWGRFGLEATMAVAGVLWVATGPSSRSAVLPLAAFALVMLQLVPLPDGLLMAIAPVSCGAWKVALAGSGGGWGTISIDPGTTLVEARRLLLGLTTVVAVADLARAPLLRRGFVAALSLCCLLVIGLALAFPSSLLDRVMLGSIDMGGPITFWKSPVHPPVQTAGACESEWVVVGRSQFLYDSWITGDRVGPYIISNHYAGALAMLVPITLAGFLAIARGRLPRWLAATIAAAAGAGALATVVLIAKSRAGTGALVLSLLVLASLVVERRWAKRLTAVAALGCAASLVAVAVAMYGPFTGIERLFPESLQHRIATILHDTRVHASGLALRMFRAAPLLGTGLGSYWPLGSQISGGALVCYYAHNDYAQLFAETGLVGCAVVASLGWLLIARFRRFYAESVPPARIVDAGPWAALAGIAAHSFFDWNLHLPANAFLASLAAGLALSSVDASPPAARRAGAGRGDWTGWAARAAVAAGCILAAAFLGRDAWSDTVQRRMRDALAEARLAASDPRRPPAAPALIDALAAGQRAMAWDPSSAQLPLLSGQISLYLATDSWPGAPAADYAESADRAFVAAQARCAACRGLPVPHVVPKKRDRP